ncbi:MAG: ribosomal L7Ae/L30e/S12e/Gadd45 family protein [Clostridia bacterium]|nr:ribosomal L7Ae/L30e/S12e/Gadd45 family protein [Clostridia bacterium]
MTDKVGTLLGFAAKSGSLCYGFEKSIAAVSRGLAKGVFFATDISAKSRKEILFHCDRLNIAAYELKDTSMDELSQAVGNRCAVIALTSESFLRPIVSYLTPDV